MKKLLLSIAIAATFVACDKNKSASGDNTTTEVTQEGKDASYAFGLSLGQQVENYKNNPANKDSLDYKAVEQGVKDYLKNPEEKNSYAFGMQLGTQITRVFEDEVLKDGLSKDEIVAGLMDYLNKKETRISADTINVLMQNFYEAQQSKAAEGNKAKGKEFIEAKKKEAGIKTTESGIAYKVIKQGTGKQAKLGDVVKVKYTGKTIDGKVFDSSEQSQPEGIEFPLTQGSLIPGWIEAVQLMKEGGKAEFYIPSELGYGDNAAGPDIKPGSTLVFDLELVEVKDAQ
ncbi:FKBP-type peptidyl-prolyl cis-trans isomerase [Weeksellaceae bacterium TAE3-ERU29]|nr:FKBP-type peptidyl-prolyl cis-trans isomerase [Weeksellaceae bacterium TAE3-ERU29]